MQKLLCSLVVCCCSQEQQRRLDAFTPAYQQLVTVVVHSVQYPSNYHEWHRDELQEFRHNRYAISEILEDAAGKPPLLPLLLSQDVRNCRSVFFAVPRRLFMPI